MTKVSDELKDVKCPYCEKPLFAKTHSKKCYGEFVKILGLICFLVEKQPAAFSQKLREGVKTFTDALTNADIKE